jgi:hypothetical protein
MGERIGRIGRGRIRTDFSWVRVLGIREKIKKKSVCIRPIRPIRSSIVSKSIKKYQKVSKYSEIRNPHSEIVKI